MAGTPNRAATSVPTVESILQQLETIGIDTIDLLRTCHNSEEGCLVPFDIRLYRAFGTQLIRAGNPTRSFELVREGSAHFPDDPQLRYLSALALARGRNISMAERQAKVLLGEPELDSGLRVEAISLIGRLYKDRYQRATNERAKVEFARKSAKRYRTAFELSRRSYPAINAATMSLLAGSSKDEVQRLAGEAIQQAHAEVRASGDHSDYWLLATIGEAYLLLEQFVGEDDDDTCAAWWYRRAVKEAGDRTGDIVAMRQQMRLIQGKWQIPKAVLEICEIGAMLVFAGHMIDHPNRVTSGRPPRFPDDPRVEDAVKNAIGSQIDEFQGQVGYSSAACGSDILFAEQMLERGAELHIVLPFATRDFCRTSVDFGLPAMRGWRTRFDAVLAKATQVHYCTSERFLDDALLFEFGNHVSQGLAITRAEQLGVDPIALVVREPTAAPLLGGTSYFLEHWITPKPRKVIEIDLTELRLDALGAEEQTASTTASSSPYIAAELSAPVVRRELKTMLFADVKGFSALREEQSLVFFGHFLNEVAELIDATNVRPVFQNTWGDGLYVVFDEPADCAEFALALLERVDQMDLDEIGLPKDLAIRIGIHTGPVYRHSDPIIKRDNFFGTDVNLTARIEPVTMPGCAYASEQFAAVLAATAGESFVCEYVGVEKLAKEFGRCALYQLGSR